MYKTTASIAAATALVLALSTGAEAAAKIRELRIEQNTSNGLPLLKVKGTSKSNYKEVVRQTTQFPVNIHGRIKNKGLGFKFYQAWVRLLAGEDTVAGKPVKGPPHTFLRDFCNRGIFQGKSVGCPPNLIGVATKSIAKTNKTFFLAYETLGGIRSQAVNTCNNLAKANVFDPKKGHTFEMPVTMYLHAKAGRPRNGIPGYSWPHPIGLSDWTGRADNTVKNSMKVKVKCEPITPPRAGSLKIASFQVHKTGSGAACPKPHDLKVVFRAGSARTIKFRVRKNGQLSELFTRTLARNGPHYEYRFVKAYSLDPGNTDFKVEVRDGPKSSVISKTVTCAPFKVISTFLKYTHGNKSYCPKVVQETTTFKTTRPGWINYEIRHEGGLVLAKGKVTSTRKGNAYIAEVKRGLPFNQSFNAQIMAVATGPFGGNSGWTRLKVDCMKLANSTLTVSDPKNKGNVCKRQGAVNAVMIFNQPGTINYRINCTNGFSKTKQTTVAKNPLSGDYRATAYHQFDVSKTGKIACVLQDADNNYKLLAGAARDFTCKPRVAVQGGATGFQVDTRPPAPVNTPDRPQRPVIKVGPSHGQVGQVPPYACQGGKQKNDVCYCPRHKKRIFTQVEYHGQKFPAYKCVEKDLKPPSPSGQSVDVNDRVKSDDAARRARAKADAERRAKLKAIAERRARAKADAERRAKLKAIAERRAKAKAAAERRARAKADAERRAKLKAIAERRAKAKAAAERRAKAKAAAKRKAKAKAAALRKAKAKAAAQRKAKAKAAAKRKAKAKADAKRKAKAKAAAKRKAKAQAAAKQRARAKADAARRKKLQAKAKRRAALRARKLRKQ